MKKKPDKKPAPKAKAAPKNIVFGDVSNVTGKRVFENAKRAYELTLSGELQVKEIAKVIGYTNGYTSKLITLYKEYLEKNGGMPKQASEYKRYDTKDILLVAYLYYERFELVDVRPMGNDDHCMYSFGDSEELQISIKEFTEEVARVAPRSYALVIRQMRAIGKRISMGEPLSEAKRGLIYSDVVRPAEKLAY